MSSDALRIHTPCTAMFPTGYEFLRVRFLFVTSTLLQCCTVLVYLLTTGAALAESLASFATLILESVYQ